MLTALLLCTVVCGATLNAQVLEEREVYTLTPPDNGSGPMWSSGCTSIAAVGDDVYISEMQTGEGVPKLCNTRWRLHKLGTDGFQCVAEAEAYRQREPTSLAVAGGSLFMYVNDSVMPPGTMYGACEPHLLKFNLNEPVSFDKLTPKWGAQTTFTDHSYRGYAADSGAGRLLMLNIDANTSIEHACMLNTAGETLATGSISFPIRACYPQVAVRGDAVHVVAVGDIVEPVEEWKKFKFEKTKANWDYVFRILYYTRTDNLREKNFAAPIEIANVDKTGGHIACKDVVIAPNGDAWILYNEQEVQSALLRDEFFPGKSIIPSLRLAVVRGEEIIERRTIVAGSEQGHCADARIHQTADGTPWIVACLTGEAGGMKLMPLMDEKADWTPIAMQKPFGTFSLASVRAGNAPSNIIHIFGTTGSNVYGYAKVRIGD